MDQQCNEVGALKYVVKLQAGICKQVRAGAVEVKNRVTALKCQSDLLAGTATRSAEGPLLTLSWGNHSEELQESQGKGGLTGRQGAGGLAGSRIWVSDESVCYLEILVCDQDLALMTAT